MLVSAALTESSAFVVVLAAVLVVSAATLSVVDVLVSTSEVSAVEWFVSLTAELSGSVLIVSSTGDCG